MSWIEDINSEFIITTGDGREYRPLWVDANKSQEYNVSEFDFVDVEGGLIVRKQPKARRFDLNIKFQGDDNLDLSSAFEISARDNRVWEISHPMYGAIFVHPLSLTFDDTAFNVTSIKGTVIETILQDAPRGIVDPVDQITANSEAADLALANSFANNVSPDTSDINLLTENSATIYNEGSVLVATDEESSSYFNAFTSANSAILNASSEPLGAIRSLQTMITAPALFAQSVRARFNMYTAAIDKLRAVVPVTKKRSEKIIYENNVGTMISAIALSCSTPREEDSSSSVESDYGSSQEIFSIVDLLLLVYNQYLADLDSMQTPNGGQAASYIPDVTALTALNTLINYTLSNLFTLALGTKQERFIYLEEDSNVIELAHRFYGLNVDDTTINDVINQNNISLLEILRIKKGREILYYV